MANYTKSMENLIAEFSKLPGVGPKTAERFAFHILKYNQDGAKALSNAILKLKEAVSYCKICNNLSEGDLCWICRDSGRDKSIICVVEEPKDVTAIEKAGRFKWFYHVLLGALSPLDGIGPDDLKIKELFGRIREDEIKEIIIATSSNTEGESTALYLAKLIKPLGIRTTRIAYGIPVGSNLDYTDQATLAKALEGRREV